MPRATIVIENRFHGPRDSGNGGYTCGRIAAFIDGPARVRLRVPPPLDVPVDVLRDGDHVRAIRGETLIAEAWPLDDTRLDVPAPPTFREAEEASRHYSGFRYHRFPTCFVCGVDREAGDGMRLFAGPVPGRDLVACPWVPDPELSDDGKTVAPVFVWSALDCPGGFSFAHPETGTILLGELAVEVLEPLGVGERAIVVGWEIRRDGRKHFTGTALFSSGGTCHGAGRAIWLEVPDEAVTGPGLV